MNILVVGIGDVAKKAYLPVYAGLKDVDVYLLSRDEQKLNEVISTYRFKGGYTELEVVSMTEIDAAMIHSTTAVHVSKPSIVYGKGSMSSSTNRSRSLLKRRSDSSHSLKRMESTSSQDSIAALRRPHRHSNKSKEKIWSLSKRTERINRQRSVSL